MWASRVLLHQRYTSWDWLISSPSSVFSRWIRCSKSACTLSVIAVWRAEAGVHNVGAISASLLFMFAKQISWHFITFIRRRAALRSFEWSIWCHQVASLILYTWCLAINYRVWWDAHFTSHASLLFVMRRLFGVWSVCYVQLYSSSALQYDVSLHWYSLTSETSVILCFHVSLHSIHVCEKQQNFNCVLFIWLHWAVISISMLTNFDSVRIGASLSSLLECYVLYVRRFAGKYDCNVEAMEFVVRYDT